MAQYGVLVFRSTALNDASHTAFASQFGELDVSTARAPAGTAYRLGPGSKLADVGNVDNAGRIEPVTSVRSQAMRGNGLFHVDCSYHARRSGYSFLRAHELPPSGTAGGTSFADTQTAYADLDEKTKEEIKAHVLWHSLLHSRRLACPEDKVFKYLDLALDLHDLRRLPLFMILALTARWLGYLGRLTSISLVLMSLFGLARLLLVCVVPGPLNARHPKRLVQLHKPSNRLNLYIAAHAYRIDGWSASASKPVIEALLRHASQEKYTFTVDWKNNGDMIFWDNTCVMHRSEGGTYQGKYVRDMRRATVYESY
ncbi:hypothetical protein N7468_010816 [Penicillium chermesinum]|uniref:TauD/TfdA-like domain-containing protein n=1 Tax=Penicillium chermesinum TaxID=63820 RepID=A0A9W9N8G7_9EURO|nr:uncharacterized protein N7468_010816 [Penicillium chermesinum]KAJ5215137.1 hypothetical protein N7468_010816 [Penicillium chermesinum]